MTDLTLKDIRIDDSSYVDPHGFVFKYEGKRYRAIRPHGETFYRKLFENGTIEKLVKNNHLVPSAISSFRIPEVECSLVISHEEISPINYCVEWCPSMLKAAALATLELNLALLEEGCLLQDAYPWNIVFKGSKPVFVDLTSLVPAESPLPWPAYQQFLNFFLYPLELMRMGKGKETRMYLRDYLHGISERDYYRNMTGTYKLRHPFNWAQGFLGALGETLGNKPWVKERVRKLAEMPAAKTSDAIRRRFLENLKSKIERIEMDLPGGSPWIDYDSGADGPGDPKSKTVGDLLRKVSPKTVLDVGCNTGHFALMAETLGASVVAMDSDEACIEALFKRGSSILPLTVDLLNPTPAFGFMSSQFPPLLERVKAELVLCLGLMHHLHISGRQSFERIASLLESVSTRAVLFEFVDRKDGKCDQIQHGRDINYTEEEVLAALGKYFKVTAFPSDKPTRKIFLCEK